MTRPADLDPYLAIALAAADLAGSVIRPHFRNAVPADLKSDDSPVTVADRGAEEAMRAMLRERCPDCGILGEEFGLERPEAALRWVLDPIDGTRAFITGRPIFATLISLMHGDDPLIGIIDQPVTRERWVGVAGRPTTFTGPIGGAAGTRICAEIGNAELSCTSPELLAEHLPRFQALQQRGEAHDLGRGRLRLRTSGAGPTGHRRGMQPEGLGLGRADAGGRGRRRGDDRLAGRKAAAGWRRTGDRGRGREAAAGGGGRAGRVADKYAALTNATRRRA